MPLSNFKNHITENLPFLKKSKLLIAISGGVDSVVLTHLCHELQFNIALAHCNFNLRGTESDADETFILNLAEDLDIEAFVQHFDTKDYAKKNKRSIQMAARELRYNWFTELAEQLKFDYILTAHHADDNLETFLINFTRGTGLEGLTGIPEVNGNFVRPLLPFSREAIETYATQNNIKWREDSSNSSVKYLRNKLRHEVVPILKEINPSLLQSFQSTLNNLKDSSDIIEDKKADLFRKGVVQLTSTGFKIDISKIEIYRNPKAYLYQFLNEYGFKEWNDVAHLLKAQSGKFVEFGTWRLIKDRGYLFLSSNSEKKQNDVLIADEVIETNGDYGVLKFNEASIISEKGNHIIYVDKDKLKYPLILRKKQEGDVFYPLGMKGKKKKLSKYFKDEKLSLLDKENTWLLCSGEDIVWVVGRRADNRFKVTNKTTTILKIELK